MKKLNNILITGGSGFLGSILKNIVFQNGLFYTNIDLRDEMDVKQNCKYIRTDVRNKKEIEELFFYNNFDGVIHLAAIMSHDRKRRKELWNTNVLATENIVNLCKKYNKKLIFISSNCLWGHSKKEAITENTLPEPIEDYGKSKLVCENIIIKSGIDYVIFRCPPIMDEGRIGLLSLLFEFIEEDKKVPIVGDGSNKYSFVYAKDVCEMCIKALQSDINGVFNLSTKNPKTFNEIYQYVIDNSHSKSKLIHIPQKLILPIMIAASKLGVSPLGKYQYSMIAANCVLDSTKAEKELNFRPSLTNEEILLKSYLYYKKNKISIKDRKSLSPQQAIIDSGIIKILKYFL